MSIHVHWWQPPPLWAATTIQKGLMITAYYMIDANHGIQEADGSIPFSSTNLRRQAKVVTPKLRSSVGERFLGSYRFVVGPVIDSFLAATARRAEAERQRGAAVS
jgi:hypothetical protein